MCDSSSGILARMRTDRPRGLCTAGRLETVARHVTVFFVRGSARRAPAGQALPAALWLVATVAKQRDEQAEHAIREVPLHTPGFLSTARTESSHRAPAWIHLEYPPRLRDPCLHDGEQGARWTTPAEPVRKQCAPRRQAGALPRTASTVTVSVAGVNSARLLARSTLTSSSAAPPSRPVG